MSHAGQPSGNKPEKPRSLARCFVFYLTLVGLAVMLVFSSLLWYLYYQQEMRQLNHQFTHVRKGYLQSISHSAWYMDDAELELLLHGIAAMPDVARVEVVDQNGSRYEAGLPSPPAHFRVKELSLNYTDTPDGQDFGMLRVYVDLQPIRQRLYQAIFWVALYNALTIFAVGLFAYLAMHRHMIRPLREITRYAKDFSLENNLPPLSLPHPSSSRGDELDQMVVTLNHMGERLRYSYRGLRDSESKLRQALDTVPTGISLHEADGALSYLNDAGKRILGQDVHSDAKMEELAKVYRAHVLNSDQLYPTERLPAMRALAGESVYINDMEIHLPDRRVPLELHARPVYDAKGEIAFAILAFQDISQRLETERLLRAYNEQLSREVAERTRELTHSENRFRGLTETTTAGILVARHNQILYSNQAARDILGYSEQELLEMDAFRMVAPRDREKVRQRNLDRMAGKSVPTRYDIQLQHNSGSLIWGDFSVNLLDIEPAGSVLITFVDITRAKQTEVALRASEERFDLAMRGTNEGIWDWEISDGKVYYSPRWMEIIGYQPDELPTNEMVFFQRLHPEDYPRVWQALYDYLTKASEAFQMEHRLRHRDGHYLWALSRGQALWNGADEPWRMVGTLMDITPQKCHEMELREARLQAESANRAKSQFLANMSHELRTPLNGILGYAQILERDTRLDSRQQRAIYIMRRSAEHLLTLIEDILDLSRIEADRLELFQVEFNLSDFLADLVEIIRLRAEQKNLYFSYHSSHEVLGVVLADEKRLRQVLLNLLSNAIKFTQQGQIEFLTERRPAGIYFEVKDTGPGIAEEELEKIFNPFHQAAGIRQFEGTGLGLSISKTLVEMMGGELRVRSELGQGSVFYFEIPLLEIEKVLDESASSSMRGETARNIVGYRGARRRLLTADDKASNQAVLYDMLTPLGFEVFQAADGREALDMAEHHHPDAIILDLVMPVMDGFELVRRLQESEHCRDIPLICTSASVLVEVQHRMLELGCVSFVGKPVYEAELLQTLRDVFDLEWVYEEESGRAAPSAATPADDQSAFPLPEPGELETLINLLKQGDVRGMLTELNALGEKNPDLQTFVWKITQLADNYNLDELEGLLSRLWRETGNA